jgi:hypothetical protein
MSELPGGREAGPAHPATGLSAPPSTIESPRKTAPRQEPRRAAAVDPRRAEALCGDAAREVLGDYAPALLMLPAAERARARALLAYARQLFALAGAGGNQADRLANIERCEQTLGLACDGQPTNEAVIFRRAEEHRQRPWPADALAQLADSARRHAVRAVAESASEAESAARGTARAAATALLGARMNTEVASFGGALLCLDGLQRLGAATEPPHCPLPAATQRALVAEPRRLLPEVRQECARLRPRLLRAPRGLVELPAPYRRAGAFCLHVALRLLSELEEKGPAPAARRRLGTLTRVTLLVRARWFTLP